VTNDDWYLQSDLESFTDYLTLIANGVEHGVDGVPLSKLWFRGQSDHYWPLVASFDRTLPDLKSAVKDRVYNDMMRAFRDRSVMHGEVWKLEEDELVCVMQHYGAPTRVLDWSTSPYVAAYFAFANALRVRGEGQRRERCAIYLLNAQDHIFRGFRTIRLIDKPPLENPRGWIQRGRFTLNLSSESDLIGELTKIYSNPAEIPDQWVLQRVTLPRSEASSALKNLELMGLTSESMFEGLEGTAKYAFFTAMDEAGLMGSSQ